jgi:hypothetical protein
MNMESMVTRSKSSYFSLNINYISLKIEEKTFTLTEKSKLTSFPFGI